MGFFYLRFPLKILHSIMFQKILKIKCCFWPNVHKRKIFSFLDESAGCHHESEEAKLSLDYEICASLNLCSYILDFKPLIYASDMNCLYTSKNKSTYLGTCFM